MNIKPEVSVNSISKSIKFTWQDGQTLDISHQQLREYCPCAFCKMKRIQNIAVSPQKDTSITAIFDQGYGAQICFSDGHDRGIFPWVFLKQISI